MKTMIIAASALALASCSAQPSANQAAAATAQRPSDAESDAYMRKAEADWAELAVKPIPGLMESSKGDVRDKAQQLKLDGPDPSFKSSRLDTVHYRHFGDTVIAQGGELLQRKDGGPDLSLIWTDVWMWRGGKWQVVASQDPVLPPTP